MSDDDEYEDDEYEDDEDLDDDANRIPVATARRVLEFVARSIVEDEDSLEVTVEDDRDPVRLNVHAAPNDMGRLIGRRGRVANAIRSVVRAAAARDDVSVDIEFVE